MIIGFQTDYHKNMLLLQAYAKAQKIINYSSQNPINPRKKFHVEMSHDMSFLEFVSPIITRFYDSVNRDQLPEELNDFMRTVMDSVNESMYVEAPSIFHFGLLLQNKHLLEVDEFSDFDHRINAMFNELSSMSCTPFMEFYNNYFRHNFFGTEEYHPNDYKELLKYTYVFFCDYEMQTIDDFGPGFMKKYADFARSYAEFYDDLTSLLERKERDSLVSI